MSKELGKRALLLVLTMVVTLYAVYVLVSAGRVNIRQQGAPDPFWEPEDRPRR
jgi:hypothetical protein